MIINHIRHVWRLAIYIMKVSKMIKIRFFCSLISQRELFIRQINLTKMDIIFWTLNLIKKHFFEKLLKFNFLLKYLNLKKSLLTLLFRPISFRYYFLFLFVIKFIFYYICLISYYFCLGINYTPKNTDIIIN